MSNKSLLASSLGVGPARGQGSHLQLSSRPARVRGEENPSQNSAILPAGPPPHFLQPRCQPGLRIRVSVYKRVLACPPPPRNSRRAQPLLRRGGSGAPAVRSSLRPQHVTATFYSGLSSEWSAGPSTPHTSERASSLVPRRNRGAGVGVIRKELERGRLAPVTSPRFFQLE